MKPVPDQSNREPQELEGQATDALKDKKVEHLASNFSLGGFGAFSARRRFVLTALGAAIRR